MAAREVAKDSYLRRNYGDYLELDGKINLDHYGDAKKFVQADDFYPEIRYGEAFGAPVEEIIEDEGPPEEWEPKTHGEKMVFHSSDFANNTSAHGVPWIANAENSYIRAIWLTVFFCCMGNFMYQIFNVIQKFNRNEKIVDIQLKFESVRFPSVTICNLNPYKQSATQSVGDISKMLKAMDDAMSGGKTTEEPPHAHAPRNKREAEGDEEEGGHHKVVFEMSYSDCTCADGAEAECTENKREEPSDHNDCCFCAFDRHSGDAWPCFKIKMWEHSECETCNDEGFCPRGGPKGIKTPCYCSPMMCVAHPGGPILKLWEYYGAGAPTDDPGFLEALGFKGMTDEVAILTKARENMMFAMAGVSNAERIAMSYSQQDLIHKCSYNGQQCDLDYDFTPILDPVFGQCFTYNHNRTNDLRAGRAGPMYGLRVMLYVNLTEYMPTTEAAGVRMTVHNKDEFPFPDTFGYSAPVGYISSFGIRLKSVDRLPAPYGDCIPEADMSRFIYTGFSYSTEGCFRSCFQNLIISGCNCGDPRFPVMKGGGNEHCSMSDPVARKCLDQRTKELGGMHGKFDCACAQPCFQSMFDVTYSAAVWPAKALKVSMCQKTPQECAKEYRENGAMVEVFYEQLNFAMLRESSAYGWVNLLSDLGGQLGLWLGVSVVTCFEVFMFVFKLLFVSGQHQYLVYKEKQAEKERQKYSG